MREGDLIWLKAVAIGGLTSVLLTTICRWPVTPPKSKLVPESGEVIAFSQVVKVTAALASFPGVVVGMAYALGTKDLSCPAWVIALPTALVYSVLAHWWLTQRAQRRGISSVSTAKARRAAP